MFLVYNSGYMSYSKIQLAIQFPFVCSEMMILQPTVHKMHLAAGARTCCGSLQYSPDLLGRFGERGMWLRGAERERMK